MPYWSYDPSSDFYDNKTVDYVVSQLKDGIKWLEEQTKQKFDVDRFQETMGLVNQARENVMEFNDLLKATPCPVNSLNGFANFMIMAFSGGTTEAVRMTKWMRDYAKENVTKGVGGVPNEKIRIAWPYTHVFFDAELFPWIEETFDAVVIMDILGHYHVSPHETSSLDECFESLALGALDYSMIDTCRGPAEYYIDYLLRFINDYKIDCVVIPIQFACKHIHSITNLAAEAIRREAGIPVLVFGCDPYDSREVPSEEIRGKIEEFITEIVL
jgi:benzoyl-CoA reductase/2-hydroxyglutaryl-CoA dehydratase subunit BcrC/BadD/HgdB